jgi:flagellar hook-associated protein 2
MATLQSPGVGSGLDINGLVSQLVAAERAPLQSRITREKTAVGTEITALGMLKGALASFNSVLTPLKTVEAFSARTAESSDSDVLTASATSGAAASQYNIRVTQLAKAQQITSAAFYGSANTEVGTGNMTISLGGASFGIAITESNSTLADIRDAINTAPDNTGVRASIVNSVDGSHLVLTSAKTGAANTITVTTDSTDGLTALAYDPDTLANYVQRTAAQDAEFTVAGLDRTSATNVVSDAIDDVTLTLKKEDPDNDVILTVAANATAAKSRIQNFVSQYNAAIRQLFDLGKYDAESGRAGPLIGDALLRSVTSELRRGVTDAVTDLGGSTITSLAQIGITTAKDGTLQLDDVKLSAAIENNFDAVGQLFGSANGIAARLSVRVTARLEVGAELALRNQTLDKKTKTLTTQTEAMERRLAQVEANYRRQFSVLDRMMAQMQSTSSYLTQQLASTARIVSGE